MRRGKERLAAGGARVIHAAGRSAVAALALLAPASLPADDINYTPVISLKEVKVVPEPASPKGPNNRYLELHFDVRKDVPKGAKIGLQLELGSSSVDQTTFVFTSGRHEDATFTWRPKAKLPVALLQVQSHLDPEAQPAAVRKQILADKEAFPPDSVPWTWYHADKEFRFGTDEDFAAEKALISKMFYDWCQQLLTLNWEFADACDALAKGTKYVEEGKVDLAALSAYVADWMKRMAAVQKEVYEFPEKQNALWQANLKLHYEMHRLSKMVAKRSTETTLKEALEKHGASPADLEVPEVEHFEADYPSAVPAQLLGVIYDRIASLADFPEPEPAEDGETGGESENADPE